MAGQTLSHYRIIEKIGEGSTGEEYGLERLPLATNTFPHTEHSSQSHQSRMIWMRITKSIITCLWVFSVSALGVPEMHGQASLGIRGDQISYGTHLVVIETEDNIALHGALYEPVGERAHANFATLYIHAIWGNFYGKSRPQGGAYRSLQAVLGEFLARKGYAFLSINMRRHDKTPQVTLFEDCIQDIGAALSFLKNRGYDDVILIGHSLGAEEVTYYLAQTKDQQVAGLVLLGAPGNLYEWAIQTGEEATRKAFEQADEKIRANQGDKIMVVSIGDFQDAVYTPDALLSYFGPQTNANSPQNIAHINQPILIAYGTKEATILRYGGQAGPKDWTLPNLLKERAVKSNMADLIYIEGADHWYTHHQEELLDRVSDWLEKLFALVNRWWRMREPEVGELVGLERLP